MVQAIESMDIQSLAGFNSGKYSFTSFRSPTNTSIMLKGQSLIIIIVILI